MLEIAVVAIVMSILAGFLLQRLVSYQAQAELAAVERVAAIIRTALTLESAQLRVRGKGDQVALLADRNPMELLMEKRENYLGEFFSPDLRTLEKGNWLYDRKDKSLVYLLNNGKTFPTGMPNLLKFKVKLIRPEQLTVGTLQQNIVTNVSLIQVDG
jgi:hypothetical protein